MEESRTLFWYVVLHTVVESFFEAIPAERRKKQKLLDINSEQAQEKPDDKTASNEKLSAAQKGVEFCNRLFYEERLL